jgi:hypothetical protein
MRYFDTRQGLGAMTVLTKGVLFEGQDFLVLFSAIYIQNKNRVLNAVFFGGAERDRTADLLNAIQTRSQLRHSPTFWNARAFTALSRERIAQGFHKCKNAARVLQKILS